MSETELEVGDRVRTVTMPSEFERNAFDSDPSEVVGFVVDIVEETKHLGPNNTMEQTFAIIEGDDGEEERINVGHLNSEIDGNDGGVTIQVLDDENETDDEDEPEIACDGGEDVTEHVDDETIEDAIVQHDDPDHPKATTIEEARDALAWVQRSIEEHWSDWLSNVENNESTVVYEDREVIVFATGEQNVPRRDLSDHYDGDLSERTPDVVSTIHHEMARERCDYDWGYEYPLVVRKSDGLEDGQEYVESIINSLMRRDLSPGQAWAYYGVEIRGNSRNAWATRCGYSDHSAVSEAVRKAKSKLP